MFDVCVQTYAPKIVVVYPCNRNVSNVSVVEHAKKRPGETVRVPVTNKLMNTTIVIRIVLKRH